MSQNASNAFVYSSKANFKGTLCIALHWMGPSNLDTRLLTLPMAKCLPGNAFVYSSEADFKGARGIAGWLERTLMH